MKILLVCSKYPPEYSGAGLRVQRMYARLRSKGTIRTEVICSSILYTAWRNEAYEIDEVQVTRISSPLKRQLLDAKERKRRLAFAFWYVLTGLDESLRTLLVLLRYHRRVDLVHTVGHCWSAGVTAVWAGVVGKPIMRELVTMQSRPDDPPGLRWLTRWALHRQGTIVAISPLLAERARQLGYERVWCRPNPVDEQRFYVDRVRRETLRRALSPFGPDDLLLVDMSKYSKGKNKELLVRMMQRLPARYKLLIAGPLERAEQMLYEELQRLIANLGLQSRVALQHGFVERPEEYLRMADVFLFPSLSDGLGTPILEAICCGIPVVANRLQGVTDVWIRDGVSGVLCEATPESFAQGVLKATGIPQAALVEAAQALIAQANTSIIDEHYLSSLLQHGREGS